MLGNGVFMSDPLVVALNLGDEWRGKTDGKKMIERTTGELRRCSSVSLDLPCLSSLLFDFGHLAKAYAVPPVSPISFRAVALSGLVSVDCRNELTVLCRGVQRRRLPLPVDRVFWAALTNKQLQLLSDK